MSAPGAMARMLLAAALLLGAPLTAAAQANPPIPASGPPQVLPADSAPTHAALPWSSLGAEQQRMLAPLQGQWAGMHPWRQRRLADHATRWAGLPATRQQEIQQRLARWAAMTPEQRRRLRDNARAFHKLTPEQQSKVTDAFDRFQSLSPAERHALWQRWRATSRERRQHPPGAQAAEAPRAPAQSPGSTH